jgi:hypothetical protein
MKKLLMITLITAAACTHSNGQINVSELSDTKLHNLVESCKKEICECEKEIAELKQKLNSAKDTLVIASKEEDVRFFENPSLDGLSNEKYDLYVEVLDTQSASYHYCRMQYHQKDLKNLYEQGYKGIYKISIDDTEPVKDVLCRFKKMHPEWQNRRLEISIGFLFRRYADEYTEKAIGKYRPQDPNQHAVTIYLY